MCDLGGAGIGGTAVGWDLDGVVQRLPHGGCHPLELDVDVCCVRGEAARPGPNLPFGAVQQSRPGWLR